MSAIPAIRASQLCEQIHADNRTRGATYRAIWCWGCSLFSRTPQRRCWANRPGNRGCAQVNQAYDTEERLFRRSPQV